MSTDKIPYRRGEFWLDHVRGRGGKPASSRWYIWWYSSQDGRLLRESTRTSDLRLASEKLDQRYLATHRPSAADQTVYTVSEAMVDYWIEHGSMQASEESIRARLKLFTRFVDHEVLHGRIRDPFLPSQIDPNLIERFRRWARKDPIVARRKGDDGEWVDGMHRQRAESTIEESVIQLKAALNHAEGASRIARMPVFRHRAREEVTPERDYRLSLDAIAELLDYSATGAGNYAGHAGRLVPLRRFVIAAISTLARPDAILDMSVAPEREQWRREDMLFALNPARRIQTKKHRPIMPIPGLLHDWLLATDEWFVCSETRVATEAGAEGMIVQRRVASVRSGWDGARSHLGIPAGWGPKLLRHSMSTILARRKVNILELEIALGHRIMSRTTSKYAHLDPDYLRSVAQGIEDVLSDLARKCGTSLSPAIR